MDNQRDIHPVMAAAIDPFRPYGSVGTGIRPASDSGFAAANLAATRGYTAEEIAGARQRKADWIAKRADELLPSVREEFAADHAAKSALSAAMRTAAQDHLPPAMPRCAHIDTVPEFASALAAQVFDLCDGLFERAWASEAKRRAEAEWRDQTHKGAA